MSYIVKEGEVIIVDEFTGRTMPGRRWSDGLHQVGVLRSICADGAHGAAMGGVYRTAESGGPGQCDAACTTPSHCSLTHLHPLTTSHDQAVEAKEDLAIQNESITLASVSYQAFFRNYPKLAGEERQAGRGPGSACSAAGFALCRRLPVGCMCMLCSESLSPWDCHGGADLACPIPPPLQA